jgi:hypothetical protein
MWKNSLPNECGYYWFFGRIQYKDYVGPLKLSIIQVRPFSKQIFNYPSAGMNSYHSLESFVGLFQKMEMPELPDLQNL